MAVNTILSKGRSDKILKYILEASTFSDQEYEILVTNTNTKDQQYFIPLIKYKFNIEPTPNLLEKATYMWKYSLQTNIKIDLDRIEDYLSFKDEVLKECIKHSSKTITNNYIFDVLFENNYVKTIKHIITWCPLSMDQELLNKLVQHKIDISERQTKIQFDCEETMYNYISINKYLDDSILKNNSHLIRKEDDYNNLTDFIIKNKEKISVSLPDSMMNKASKGLFRLFLHGDSIDMEKAYDKFYKYPDLWNEVDLNKLHLGYTNRYCNGMSEVISGTDTVFDRVKKFVAIVKGTRVNNGHSFYRYNFKLTNKPDILLYFDILFYKRLLDLKGLEEIKAYIEKEKQTGVTDVMKNTSDKLILILNKYIEQKKKDQPKLVINNNDLPILPD